MVVERLGPFEGDVVDVEIGVASFLFPKETVLFAKRAREFLKPHDVVAHGSEDGAYDAGTRDAADAVDVVVRGEFARAALGEVVGIPLRFRLFVRKVVVEEVSVLVLREGRVRRKADALLNRNVVDGNGDRFGRGVGGEFPAVRVKVARFHHAHGRAGLECVGALQVVVLIERFVDAVGVGRFVRRIGALRIERAGTAPAEGRKERLLRVLLHVARSVEHDALRGKRQGEYGYEKPTGETLQKKSFPSRRRDKTVGGPSGPFDHSIRTAFRDEPSKQGKPRYFFRSASVSLREVNRKFSQSAIKLIGN